MRINKPISYAAGVGALLAVFAFAKSRVENNLSPEVNAKSALIRTAGDTAYRDLNKNGKMDVYEDVSQLIEKRVQDLLKQMNIEEKAGMMFYSPVRVNKDGTIEEQPAKDFLASISPVGVKEIDN